MSSTTPARERLSKAQSVRGQVRDASAHIKSDDSGIALAIAETDVIRALMGVMTDKNDQMWTSLSSLQAEALELSAECRRIREKGFPIEEIEFASFAARGLAWTQRWRVFSAELSGIVATKH